MTQCIYLGYTHFADEINILGICPGFEWDEGIFLNNSEKYGLTAAKCEQFFFNRLVVSKKDLEQSKRGGRFYSLGHTDDGRGLFVVSTIRNSLIQVIPFTDMNRKKVYESL